MCATHHHLFPCPTQLLTLIASSITPLYPPTAPAVTFKQLSTVAMVTHTTAPDFCCHRPSLSSTPRRDCRTLSQSSDRSLICIMWRMALMPERGQAGWLSRLTEKWSADVKLRDWNFKKKKAHMVTGKGENVALHVSECCLLPGVFPFPSWLPALTDTFFFSLDVSACLPPCVCPGWPTEVFPRHASLSPRALLLAARAKRNSSACKEQCTPSAVLSILKLGLERCVYMEVHVFSIHASFNQMLSFWVWLWENAAVKVPLGNAECMRANCGEEIIQTSLRKSPPCSQWFITRDAS